MYAAKDNPRRRLDSILAKWIRISELNTSSYEIGIHSHGMFGCQYTRCTSPVRRLCDAIVDQNLLRRTVPLSSLMIQTNLGIEPFLA
jgi:exoribonuclease R